MSFRRRCVAPLRCDSYTTDSVNLSSGSKSAQLWVRTVIAGLVWGDRHNAQSSVNSQQREKPQCKPSRLRPLQLDG